MNVTIFTGNVFNSCLHKSTILIPEIIMNTNTHMFGINFETEEDDYTEDSFPRA